MSERNQVERPPLIVINCYVPASVVGLTAEGSLIQSWLRNSRFFFEGDLEAWSFLKEVISPITKSYIFLTFF